MKRKYRIVALALAGGVVLSLAACSKTRGQARPSAGSAKAGAGIGRPYEMAGARQPSTVRGQGLSAASGTTTATTGQIQPGPAAPDTPRYLNIQAPPVEIPPSDFSIGPLENLRPDSQSSSSTPHDLLTSLASFLDSVLSGKPDYSEVLDGRAPLVATILDNLPAGDRPGKPVSWRLGKIKADGEEAVASFALFAAPIDLQGPARLPPRSDGRIHARLVGTTWYIEDLSFDATTLANDRTPPDPPWEPAITEATTQ